MRAVKNKISFFNSEKNYSVISDTILSRNNDAKHFSIETIWLRVPHLNGTFPVLMGKQPGEYLGKIVTSIHNVVCSKNWFENKATDTK